MCNVISSSLFVEESGGVCHKFHSINIFLKSGDAKIEKKPVVHILLVLHILPSVITPFCHISTQKAFMHLIYIVSLKLFLDTDLQCVFSFLSANFFAYVKFSMCDVQSFSFNGISLAKIFIQV